MKYTVGDGTEVCDENGKQIIRLLGTNCTHKRAQEITRLLVDVLNTDSNVQEGSDAA